MRPEEFGREADGGSRSDRTSIPNLLIRSQGVEGPKYRVFRYGWGFRAGFSGTVSTRISENPVSKLVTILVHLPVSWLWQAPIQRGQRWCRSHAVGIGPVHCACPGW